MGTATASCTRSGSTTKTDGLNCSCAHREPDEDISFFKRRVRRECSKAISTKWSSLWYQSAISWHKHLLRDWEQQKLHYDDGIATSRLSTCFSWAPLIVNTWGSEWLSRHRVYSTNNSKLESRLFRRACSGHVNMRWAEGIDQAMAGEY